MGAGWDRRGDPRHSGGGGGAGGSTGSGTPPLPSFWRLQPRGRLGFPAAGRFQRNVSFLPLPAPLQGGPPRVGAGSAPGPERVGEPSAARPAPAWRGGRMRWGEGRAGEGRCGEARPGSRLRAGVAPGAVGGGEEGALWMLGGGGSPSSSWVSTGPQPVSLGFCVLGKPSADFQDSCFCLGVCVSLHVPCFWKSPRVCQSVWVCVSRRFPCLGRGRGGGAVGVGVVLSCCCFPVTVC